MAQVHDFVVLNKETYAYEDHMQLVNQVPYDVSIHDNLIMFFYGFLQQIPTYNPSKKVRHTGLNCYGITIIDSEGALVTYNIISSIVNVMKLSPKFLKFSKGYTYKFAEEQEKLIFQKYKVVDQFDQLKGCIKQVIDSNGQLYIVHLGI